MTKPSLEIAEDKFIKISWGAIVSIVVAVFIVGGWAVSQEIRSKDNTDKIIKTDYRVDEMQNSLGSIDKKIDYLQYLVEDIRKHTNKGR